MDSITKVWKFTGRLQSPRELSAVPRDPQGVPGDPSEIPTGGPGILAWKLGHIGSSPRNYWDLHALISIHFVVNSTSSFVESL